MSELIERLKKEFQDEDYRYAYDEEFSNARVATQIKVLREQQKLKQTELAERAGMKQSRISELENVNYNAWSIGTLRRLARALGVRLSFAFESWGELLPEVDSFGRQALEKPRFEKDPAFESAETPVNPAGVAVGSTAKGSALRLVPVSGTPVGIIQKSLVFAQPELVVESASSIQRNITQEESGVWPKTALSR